MATKEEAIEKILELKHGSIYGSSKFPSNKIQKTERDGDASKEIKNRVQEAKAIVESDRGPLLSKTEQEIFELLAIEIDKKRLFSQADAVADLTFWGKMPYWRIEEGITLLFEKDPEKVSWETINNQTTLGHSESSPFVERYSQIRELARRSVRAGSITDPITPSAFLKWASNNDFYFPRELLLLVKDQAQKKIDRENISLEADPKQEDDIEQGRPIDNTLLQWQQLIDDFGGSDIYIKRGKNIQQQEVQDWIAEQGNTRDVARSLAKVISDRYEITIGAKHKRK